MKYFFPGYVPLNLWFCTECIFPSLKTSCPLYFITCILTFPLVSCSLQWVFVFFSDHSILFILTFYFSLCILISFRDWVVFWQPKAIQGRSFMCSWFICITFIFHVSCSFPLYWVFTAIICIIITRRGYSSYALAVIFQLNVNVNELWQKYRINNEKAINK